MTFTQTPSPEILFHTTWLSERTKTKKVDLDWFITLQKHLEL